MLENIFLLAFYLMLFCAAIVFSTAVMEGLIWLKGYRSRRNLKLRHKAMKIKIDDYLNRDTIAIAQEFAKDCEKPKPIRKACGMFSDEAAQEIVK